MRAYLITTGTLFGLLTIAHFLRVLQERNLAEDPWYIVITVVAAALSAWAWRLFAISRRPTV